MLQLLPSDSAQLDHLSSDLTHLHGLDPGGSHVEYYEGT